MTKTRYGILTITLLAGLLPSALAQAVNDFKVGDWAQINYAGQWRTVTIATPLDSGGYKVNYGASVMPVNANPNEIRHYTPTAAESQAALDIFGPSKKSSQGDTLGGKFGTREPAKCANRQGPINAATAKQYFICDSEGELFRNTLFLVSDVTVQVASPRPFNYNLDSSQNRIDTRAQVYDIRGSYNHYQCDAQATYRNAFANSHNCSKFLHPTAEGRCWKDTFGDWHCTMAGGPGAQLNNQVPPAGY